MQVNCKLYFISYLLIRVRKAFFEWGAGNNFFYLFGPTLLQKGTSNF